MNIIDPGDYSAQFFTCFIIQSFLISVMKISQSTDYFTDILSPMYLQ